MRPASMTLSSTTRACSIKAPGGAATGLHQDSAYWAGREATPTIFSVWIALEDMSAENGGLMLSAPNEVGVSDMSTFNTGSTLEHEQIEDPPGGFPILITAPIASQLEDSMKLVSLAKGESVAFDSHEPHMSGPNLTETPRLAMKVAYAEGEHKARCLIRTRTLESPQLTAAIDTRDRMT